MKEILKSLTILRFLFRGAISAPSIRSVPSYPSFRTSTLTRAWTFLLRLFVFQRERHRALQKRFRLSLGSDIVTSLPQVSQRKRKTGPVGITL